MTKDKTEHFEFQSEVKQLLDILVYSLYKNKDVFLRELISNAADALNKVRFEQLTNPQVEDKDLDLRIDISLSKTQKKITIEDTGIGMTRQELVDNIGTIARSGTTEFLQKLSEAKNKDRLELIGQFGVGFYSSFMVAEKIHITTKSFTKGQSAWLWKSAGEKDYTIEETIKKIRGTRIELFLKKEEQKDFLDKEILRGIIHNHSKFVPFPIYLEGEKIESAEAIWTQPKGNLKDTDYTEFYQYFENTKEEPETHLHISSDAPVQFNALLYIPKTSLEALGFFKMDPGIDLYSKKVLIQKNSKDILPEYLRFIKGVVDSEDIPLNISRETIQNNIRIEKIRKHLMKKIFAHLKSMKTKDRDGYLRIWSNFGRHIKEGIIEDFENRERMAGLLLFHSSKEKSGEAIDLDTYIERMDKDQSKIYWASATDTDSMENNPALEAFKSKGLEVLFLTEPLEEFALENLGSYKDKEFQPVEAADIQLEKEASPKDKEHLDDVNSLVSFLKGFYGERVADVRISRRLVKSPCLLVQAEGSPSPQMEKIMKMTNKDYTFAKRIFEINPDNPLILEMTRIFKKDPKGEGLARLADQLLDNMLMREGLIEDLEGLVPRLEAIMLEAAKGVK
jgi:HSP90 family molecular chaperone